MKNVFRTTGSALAAILVAWTAAAATPAEAYYGYDNAYTYDYSNSYGYDNAYTYDYSNTFDAPSYSYDYGSYAYDYGSYPYSYGNAFDGFGYTVSANAYAGGPTYSFGGGCGIGGCGGSTPWIGGCTGSSCGNRQIASCTGSSCNKNRHDDLQVECRVTDETLDEGDCVTYSVRVSGGNSPFDYRWSGDTEGEDTDGKTIRVCYDDAGDYEVKIQVTDDDGNRDSDTCEVSVDDRRHNDDFDVECRVSDDVIDEGDCVTYSVRVSGGNSPFDYDWNGDLEGNRNDNDRTIRVCYDDSGDYEVSVVVRDDDGNRESDSCEVEVRSGGRRGITTRSNGNPSGTLASVDAVYLSQIPYTGPEETAAMIAAALAVIGIGFGAAISLKKRAMRRETASRVAAFKAENLARKQA